MLSTTRFILVSAFSLMATLAYAQYSGGSGTAKNPFLISSLEDLKMLTDSSGHWNKYFKLTQDIDAEATMGWNEGKGFSPIGNYNAEFQGGFDGNWHTIRNLAINRMGESYIGLFGVTEGGYIRNLVLKDCRVRATTVAGTLVGMMGWVESAITEVSNIDIQDCKVEGGYRLGGLVGEVNRGRIENCTIHDTVIGNQCCIGGLAGWTGQDTESWIRNCKVSAFVSGSMSVGGLIGENRMTVYGCQADVQMERSPVASSAFGGFAGVNSYFVNQCIVSGTIITEGYNNQQVGGFVGLNDGWIRDCSSSANVEAPDGKCIGGFAGANSREIKSSYATGDVKGKSHTGGFAGMTTEGSTIANSYATGTTTAGDRTGGFIGENSYFATCTHCYSSGKVISDAWFSGGLIGLNRSTAHCVGCFFDFETSAGKQGIGMNHNGQNPAPTGLSTEGFADQQVFVDESWGFGNSAQHPWQIGMAHDGFIRPVLYFQTYTVEFQADTGGFLMPDSLCSQLVTIGNNSASVLAVTLPKYEFYAWFSPGGDSLTNVNPLAVSNIRRDTLLIARFIYYDDIDDISAIQMNVYPNPASSRIFIEVDFQGNASEMCYTLTDIQGRLMIRICTENTKLVLDVSHLDPGVYSLGFTSGTSQFYRKVVVR